MDIKNIKMKKSVEEFEAGSAYEIDSETAQKWIDAGLCEEVENPSDKIVKKLQEAVDSKIEKAMNGLAASLKVESPDLNIRVKEEKKSLGEFVQLLDAKNYDKLISKYGLVEGKTLNTSDDSAIVPTPLANDLLFSAGYKDSIYRWLKQVPMSSTTLKYPVLNQAGTSPSGSTSQSCFGGGVYGTFVSEDTDASEKEPAFTSITLTAARYTAYTKLTPEIRMANAIDLERFLVDEFGRAFLRDMDYYIVNGSGSTQPTGVKDHAATIEVTRNTTLRVKYVDLITMIGKFVGLNDGVWVCHPTAYADLLRLEDGSGAVVWQPNAVESSPGTLFGMPIVISEMCATLGSDADVILLNPMSYIWGQLRDLRISVSDHVDFLKGRRTYRMDAWVDGKPMAASTYLLNDGSTQVGNVVQLGSNPS
jgi:HK97 family phage major capsid protein